MATGLVARGLGRATAFPPSLLGTFSNQVNSLLADVKPNDWFGPGQPLPKVAPPGVRTRRLDYSPAINLNIQPKAYEGETYDTLRWVADAWPLMRAMIDKQKNQVARVPWEIGYKPKPGESKSDTQKRNQNDTVLQNVRTFWEYPDSENSFADWVRLATDEMLTIDATTVCPRWTVAGDLYAFDIIDGATITRVLDEQGRTPAAPFCAYRQILHGMPAVDLMQMDNNFPGADMVLFAPRNKRTNKLYGLSPVEALLLTANVGLRREMWQLQYYTQGNMPDTLLELPQTATIDQADEYAALWDAEVNSNSRRKVRFIPYGTKPHFTQDAKLADEMDEFIIRRVAFYFGVSVGSLVRMVNRASGEQMSEDSSAEGLDPILTWLAQLVNKCIAFMGFPDMEFKFAPSTKEDPLSQAKIDQMYLESTDSDGNSPLDANEVRDRTLGLPPKVFKEKPQPQVLLPQISGAQKRETQEQEAVTKAIFAPDKRVRETLRLMRQARAIQNGWVESPGY